MDWVLRDGTAELRRFIMNGPITALSEGEPVGMIIPHVESVRVSCSCGEPHEETKRAIEGVLR